MFGIEARSSVTNSMIELITRLENGFLIHSRVLRLRLNIIQHLSMACTLIVLLLFFVCLFLFIQNESLKWTDHGNTLLGKNDFVSAEKCANFALFFQTSSRTRAQACLCKAFAQYEMGKASAARREINEIKRLDSDLARVRRSAVYIKHRKISYCLIRTNTKCSAHCFCFQTVAQERKDFAITIFKGRNYEGSIKHLNLALWLHPEDGSEAKFKRSVESHQATAYFKLKNYKKAVELGEESYKTNTSFRSKVRPS